MIDILYLTHNRLEFTKASLQALIDNTDWSAVNRLVICDDHSQDGTRDYLRAATYPVRTDLLLGHWGHPVLVMKEFLKNTQVPMFAKVDNDTMLPPGWLPECLNVMEKHDELDLLGIEPFRPIVAGKSQRSYDAARHIGGIGLMRARAFKYSQPIAYGSHQGFTSWQGERSDQGLLVPGWLNPALPVFLLDHLPREPWRTLTGEYISKEWARRWEDVYGEDGSAQWSWYCS